MKKFLFFLLLSVRLVEAAAIPKANPSFQSFYPGHFTVTDFVIYVNADLFESTNHSGTINFNSVLITNLITVSNIISQYINGGTAYITNIGVQNLTINGVLFTNSPHVWTNDTSISTVYTIDASATNIFVNNLEVGWWLRADQAFSLGSISTSPTLGTNFLDTTITSDWVLNSVTNDPAQVFIGLSPPRDAQQLFLINGYTNSAWTLVDGQTNSTGGGLLRLQGDFIASVTNQGILLIGQGEDWVEVGRFNPSVLAPVAMNPTPGYLPYNSNNVAFGDSPIYRADANSMIVSNVIDGELIPFTFKNGYSAASTQPGNALAFNLTAEDGTDVQSFKISAGRGVAWPTQADAYSQTDFYSTYAGSPFIQLQMSGFGLMTLFTPVAIGTSYPIDYSFMAATPFTAATNAPQNSPGVQWRASGWNSTNASANIVFFTSYATAIQSAGAPIGEWILQTYNPNGATGIVAKVSANSGYTGTGMNFLSDDGTFKVGTGLGTTINSLDGYIPVRGSATEFTNSPFIVKSVNEVLATNAVLSFDRAGQTAVVGLSAGGIASYSASGTVTLESTSGLITLENNGQNWIFLGNNMYPGTSNTFALGQYVLPFFALYLATNSGSGLVLGTNIISDNGTDLTRNGVPIVAGGGVINSLDGYIPVRGSATTFTNSPINVESAINVKIGNVHITTPGSIYSDAGLGLGSFDGSSISLSEGTNVLNFLSKAFYPNESNAVNLGSSTIPFKSLYLGTNSLYLGTNAYTDNGTSLLRNGVALAPASGGAYIATLSGIGTNTTLYGMTNYGTVGATNFTTTSAMGWLDTNSTTGGSVTISSGAEVVSSTLKIGTNTAIAATNLFEVVSTIASLSPAFSVNTNGNAYFTTNILIGNGSAARPGLTFASTDDGTASGFHWDGSAINVDINGVARAIFYVDGGVSATYFQLGASSIIQDSVGAGNIQMGVDAASPINQTLKAADGVGTDENGANLSVKGGQSTGNGRPGALIGQTATYSSATGSSLQSYQTRFHFEAKPVTVVTNTATTFLSVTNATNTFVSMVIHPSLFVSDGTDFQTLSSTLQVGGVNKNGTVTPTITQVDGTAAVSAGTLSCTYTAVANGNNIDVKATYQSSLTAITNRVYYNVISMSGNEANTITVQ